MGALRDFVADMLESEGAAIEPVEPDGLEVLAPEPLRSSLGWPEFARLGFGSHAAQRGRSRSDSKATGSTASVPFWASVAASPSGSSARLPVAPPSDPQRLLDRALDLPNAVWRLHDAHPTWTRCLLLFRYTAISDEKREGLVWLGFNQGTGAVMDDDSAARLRRTCERRGLAGARRRTPAGRGPLAGPVAAMSRRVLSDWSNIMSGSIWSLFSMRMRRRLDRDRGRVHAILSRFCAGTALKLLAALGSASGEKAEADRRRETLRIAAIEREYAAKLDDLRHNYDLRVTVDWVQGLTLFAPVHRYDVLIKRRKGERTMRIDWHPAIRSTSRRPAIWGWGSGGHASCATIICISPTRLGKLPAHPAAKPGAVPATDQVSALRNDGFRLPVAEKDKPQ